MHLHVSTREGAQSQTPESNGMRCRNGSNITSQLENWCLSGKWLPIRPQQNSPSAACPPD